VGAIAVCLIDDNDVMKTRLAVGDGDSDDDDDDEDDEDMCFWLCRISTIIWLVIKHRESGEMGKWT
jgi:hypothetical protein